MNLFNEHLLADIRARFEHVDSDPISGKRIFFENAGGTLRLKSVLAAVQFFTALPDNAGRRNKTSRKIGQTIIQGRKDVATLLGATSGSIASEQSGTGMIFRILGTIARSVRGTNVVTSNLEHPAVYDACNILARRHGLECRIAKLDKPSGVVPVEAVTSLIDGNTVMLAIIHASNILGTVNDVKRMIHESRRIKPELYAVIDGCQYASHGLVDVPSYGADAYVLDAYKVSSKIGTNFAHIGERLARLDRDNLAGKADEDWDLGTREPAAFASISCVLEYLQWLGGHFATSMESRDLVLSAMQAIADHEHALMRLMFEGQGATPGLARMPAVTVYGEKKDLTRRQAIFAFNLNDTPAADLVDYFEANGVRVHSRSRDAYSRHTLAALEIPECIRVSLSHYNTPEEVLTFLKLLGDYRR
jgi:cysteine desulfurase / selenocysteine lyase